MKITEQLIIDGNEKRTIKLNLFFSYIQISKMIVSGIEESKEILLKNMILRMTFKKDNTFEVKEIYLASLISGKLPILEHIIEIPYETVHKIKEFSVLEEDPEKLFNEIDLEFIFDDDENKKENEIKLYIFFERSPGIEIINNI
jgi:sporulation protein YlmC with PRC-barrel domain